MESKTIKLFVVSDNALVAQGLRRYLNRNFNGIFEVSCFYDSRSCVRHIESDTQVVVIDDMVEGRSATDISKMIYRINPDVKVIDHHSEQEVGALISEMLSGEMIDAKKYSFKVQAA